MNGYLLFALDMDGTLLNSEHVTTPYTRAVLNRAAEAGCVLALSTGRALSELRAHLEAVPAIGYVIGESGACLYDVAGKRALRQVVLDDHEVDAVLEAAEGVDLIYQVFVDNQSYIRYDDEPSLEPYHIAGFAEAFQTGSMTHADLPGLCRQNRGHVEKVNLYFSADADRVTFLRRIEGRPLAVTGSIGVGAEVSPLHIDKGTGLKLLCEHLDIPISQTMAVGDGGNDLEIMSAAGFAVAMGNAIPELRALADAVTEDNDHDGVANAIRRYVLGEEI